MVGIDERADIFLPLGTVTVRRRITTWVMNPGPPLRKPKEGKGMGAGGESLLAEVYIGG